MADIFDPQTSTPEQTYEDGVLKWIEERVKEGDAVIKDEPSYDEIDKAIAYIMGDQLERMRPSELSACPDNRLKNILNQTVAALTDIHPLFGFKTYNPAFKDQEEVLVKLSQAWWVNRFADLKLADVIKFAAGIGTGYCEVAWDASLDGGTGDITLRALDPRDVLPIRPSLNGSVQDWDGVIIRVAKTPDEMKARFPDKRHKIEADNQPTIAARTWSRARKLMSTVFTPSAVDVSNASNARNSPRKVASLDVFTVYMKDRRLHVGNDPIIMGDPNTTWSYKVYPAGYDKVPDGEQTVPATDPMTGMPLMDPMTGAPVTQTIPKFRKATIQESKLYPRGRMIVATRKTVLYDGPNPYWHGMFPVAKLTLDPWPWSLLGLGLVHDLIPIQDALNETLNGILDHVRKLLRPAVVADKKSVAESIWQRIDTRLPGLKLKTNATAGKGVEFVSPDPLPEYTFEVLKFLTDEMDYHAGTPNMSAMLQLQQMPGEDTIEKMQEALTPVVRLKSRLLEYFLREVGEMVKANFFQFYNLPRRIAMLGDAGIAFNDFDFDPGTLIPALAQGDPGYSPELDKRLDRPQRAQWFHKNFTFSITPNSLLAVSQTSRKLMYLQLRREPVPLIDRWTLYDVLEIPNGGTPPNGAQTITDRLMAEQILMMQQQQQAAMMGMIGAAMGGPMLESENPGRPPSGQSPPSLQQKSDGNGGTRTTVSESGTGGKAP